MWTERMAKRTNLFESSVVRELLKLTAKKDLISFAGGLPGPETFPVEEFREASNKVLKDNGIQALQYTITEGYPPLREFLASYLSKKGIKCSVKNILLTNGSQQALDLIAKVMCDPGDYILLEEPSYLGAIQAFTAYETKFATIPIDKNGTLTNLLEEKINKYNPKFVYLLPNFHNPAGVTLSLDRRKEVIEVANKTGALIIEDDPYGDLRYTGESLSPIKSFDTNENVIYLGTFSKILSPGVRIGWIVAPDSIMIKLVEAKQGTDLCSSPFIHMVVYELCRNNILETQIPKIKKIYGERCKLMLDAIAKYFPEGSDWTKPEGGLFIWAQLQEKYNTKELFTKAIEKNVAYVPGFCFYANGGGESTMRLNFSNAQNDMIEVGIKRLSEIF
ncbi:putative transcriptional regulator, GntR family [Thermodesulfobium narugense DSM 14796]|uniref:Putative transcriptional regulator, GntR family n=1 Tax=Thermodesulfobium narugense DSM 14796 TaxID=747365 RepID=M1E7M3_9BACT|nr:PLP-dependent aminotransferase family protein [Thermodesulfobium narugense]AEE14708.1 putative transcriptional regulator, GntR family [Thermodesulfobium narugense DSM 14796]